MPSRRQLPGMNGIAMFTLRSAGEAISDEPFVAIDFETADHGPDSACAVGLVRVERYRIVRSETVLIRPPRRRFFFAHIHGITWSMVEMESPFGEVWPRLAAMLEGAVFLAAHNAPFDRGVLSACCNAAGLTVPEQKFLCTVQLARRTWKHRQNDLASVCRRLGIGLKHHDAGSDAEACARIVLAAHSERAARRTDESGITPIS
jgi:DNA polymerase-3 subunit epsilon